MMKASLLGLAFVVRFEGLELGLGVYGLARRGGLGAYGFELWTLRAAARVRDDWVRDGIDGVWECSGNG